jgi:hypothetical protein
MAKMFKFVVEGTGHFPVDMLRYDRCTPCDSEDVNWCFTVEGKRSAMMISSQHPTVARWNSFGWSVDMIRKV